LYGNFQVNVAKLSRLSMSEKRKKCLAAHELSRFESGRQGWGRIKKMFARRHLHGIRNGIKAFMVLLKAGEDLFVL
jgi:hypothetical protein